jgi:hypothetical protein
LGFESSKPKTQLQKAAFVKKKFRHGGAFQEADYTAIISKFNAFTFRWIKCCIRWEEKTHRVQWIFVKLTQFDSCSLFYDLYEFTANEYLKDKIRRETNLQLIAKFRVLPCKTNFASSIECVNFCVRFQTENTISAYLVWCFISLAQFSRDGRLRHSYRN